MFIAKKPIRIKNNAVYNQFQCKFFQLNYMFQQKKNLLFILILILCCASCQKKKWIVVQHASTKIAIDSTAETSADKNYEAFLQPYKEQMAEKMDVVIGQAAQAMRVSRPESLLSNFGADITRKVGADYLGENVDISIVNMGGLRTEISEGSITVGSIYELMPFENELVILWLRGDKVAELCDAIASVNGEGVSGIKMGIKDGKVVEPTIGGKAVDMEKIYIIATSDYLAEGNDKLVQLAEYEKQEKTGIKIRDAFIDYIKNETEKGKQINSQLDGRIYEIK